MSWALVSLRDRFLVGIEHTYSQKSCPSTPPQRPYSRTGRFAYLWFNTPDSTLLRHHKSVDALLYNDKNITRFSTKTCQNITNSPNSSQKQQKKNTKESLLIITRNFLHVYYGFVGQQQKEKNNINTNMFPYTLHIKNGYLFSLLYHYENNKAFVDSNKQTFAENLLLLLLLLVQYGWILCLWDSFIISISINLFIFCSTTIEIEEKLIKKCTFFSAIFSHLSLWIALWEISSK